MIRESPHSTGPLDTALDLHRKTLRLIPLAGKRALVKDWPNLHLGEEDIRAWSRKDVNWGILTGEPLVVLDTDSEQAEAWVRAQGINSSVVVRSGGGGLHRYFRTPEHAEIRSRCGVHGIRGLDVKGWHSYIVAAGSRHPETQRRYEYLPGKELLDLAQLPVFDPAWVCDIRAELRDNPSAATGGRRIAGDIRDVRAYVRAIPSIEGQGGDKACFRVACLLAEAGFSFEEALAEIAAWNETNAFPPWSKRQLIHKIRSAMARVLR